jgi:hypothetical protein
MQGEERNPRTTILKSSRSRGTGLGGRAHRHPLTRITGDQAGSGIGQGKVATCAANEFERRV